MRLGFPGKCRGWSFTPILKGRASQTNVGNPLTIYRGLSGPPGPEKVWKKSPGAGVWKKSRKSLSGPFREFFQILGSTEKRSLGYRVCALCLSWRNSSQIVGVLRALRGPLKNLWKPLKTSENLWKPLKTSKNLWKALKSSETIPLRGPLRDPLRGRFPSQNLSGLLPLIVLPL